MNGLLSQANGWISLQGRSSGSGNGTVNVVVASTTGPVRSGTVTIAGQPVAVTQSPGCAFSISPETATAPSAASTGKVAVALRHQVRWTATSNAPWLTISSGSSGTGNGDVQYAPLRPLARLAWHPHNRGQTFTLNQGEGCMFTLSSSSAAIDDEGSRDRSPFARAPAAAGPPHRRWGGHDLVGSDWNG